MYIPHTVTPQTSAGGDRSNSLVGAKWDRREPAPFYYHKQTDRVDDKPCSVCEAPLHVYELAEHEEACRALEASDGKDKPLEVDDGSSLPEGS